MANELEGPSTGKSWRIKPEKVKLSLEDILSRLFQYSNIADAAARASLFSKNDLLGAKASL